MKKVIHKADTRGHSKYEWLDSYHTFSFDEYFDSNRINFGALRVLNDDKVAPGEGFQTHPHKNMEIVSIPLKGHLQHGDSKKNSRIITVGEIQTMSAGTGIFHSEMNASPVEPVEFLQIWIMPRERNTRPVYQDFNISELERPNELAVIVSARRKHSRFPSARCLVLYRQSRSRKETWIPYTPKSCGRLHLSD